MWEGFQREKSLNLNPKGEAGVSMAKREVSIHTMGKDWKKQTAAQQIKTKMKEVQIG